MAIVKANFVPREGDQKKGAKAHIKYIEHRRGKEGERVARVLFGSHGQMSRMQAYTMVDQASEKSYFYRMVLSPDPVKEDTRRDLLLREITQQAIDSLEERLFIQIPWVGVVHADHRPHRHVHLLAILPRKLVKQELEAMRLTATEITLEQRRELDAALEHRLHEAERTQEKQWEL